jgi:hypothetical protein
MRLLSLQAFGAMTNARISGSKQRICAWPIRDLFLSAADTLDMKLPWKLDAGVTLTTTFAVGGMSLAALGEAWAGVTVGTPGPDTPAVHLLANRFGFGASTGEAISRGTGTSSTPGTSSTGASALAGGQARA